MGRAFRVVKGKGGGTKQVKATSGSAEKDKDKEKNKEKGNENDGIETPTGVDGDRKLPDEKKTISALRGPFLATKRTLEGIEKRVGEAIGRYEQASEHLLLNLIDTSGENEAPVVFRNASDMIATNKQRIEQILQKQDDSRKYQQTQLQDAARKFNGMHANLERDMTNGFRRTTDKIEDDEQSVEEVLSSSNAVLNVELKTMEDCQVRTNKRMENSVNSYSRQVEEVRMLKEKIVKLEQKGQRAKKIKELQSELHSCHHDIMCLKTASSEYEKEIAAMKEENEALDLKLRVRDEEIVRLSTSAKPIYESTEYPQKAETTETTENTNKVEPGRGSVAMRSLTFDLEQANDTIQKLEIQLLLEKDKTKESNKVVATLETQLEQFKSIQVGELQELVENQGFTITRMKREAETLREQNEESRKAMSEMKSKHLEMVELTSKLLERESALGQHVDGLKSQLSQAITDMNNVEYLSPEQIESSRKRLEENEMLIEKLQDKIELLKAEISHDRRKAANRLESELQKQRAELEQQFEIDMKNMQDVIATIQSTDNAFGDEPDDDGDSVSGDAHKLPKSRRSTFTANSGDENLPSSIPSSLFGNDDELTPKQRRRSSTRKLKKTKSMVMKRKKSSLKTQPEGQLGPTDMDENKTITGSIEEGSSKTLSKVLESEQTVDKATPTDKGQDAVEREQKTDNTPSEAEAGDEGAPPVDEEGTPSGIQERTVEDILAEAHELQVEKKKLRKQNKAMKRKLMDFVEQSRVQMSKVIQQKFALQSSLETQINQVTQEYEEKLNEVLKEKKASLTRMQQKLNDANNRAAEFRKANSELLLVQKSLGPTQPNQGSFKNNHESFKNKPNRQEHHEDHNGENNKLPSSPLVEDRQPTVNTSSTSTKHLAGIHFEENHTNQTNEQNRSLPRRRLSTQPSPAPNSPNSGFKVNEKRPPAGIQDNRAASLTKQIRSAACFPSAVTPAEKTTQATRMNKHIKPSQSKPAPAIGINNSINSPPQIKPSPAIGVIDLSKVVHRDSEKPKLETSGMKPNEIKLRSQLAELEDILFSFGVTRNDCMDDEDSETGPKLSLVDSEFSSMNQNTGLSIRHYCIPSSIVIRKGQLARMYSLVCKLLGENRSEKAQLNWEYIGWHMLQKCREAFINNASEQVSTLHEKWKARKKNVYDLAYDLFNKKRQQIESALQATVSRMTSNTGTRNPRKQLDAREVLLSNLFSEEFDKFVLPIGDVHLRKGYTLSPQQLERIMAICRFVPTNFGSLARTVQRHIVADIVEFVCRNTDSVPVQLPAKERTPETKQTLTRPAVPVPPETCTPSHPIGRASRYTSFKESAANHFDLRLYKSIAKDGLKRIPQANKRHRGGATREDIKAATYKQLLGTGPQD